MYFRSYFDKVFMLKAYRLLINGRIEIKAGMSREERPKGVEINYVVRGSGAVSL